MMTPSASCPGPSALSSWSQSETRMTARSSLEMGGTWDSAAQGKAISSVGQSAVRKFQRILGGGCQRNNLMASWTKDD